MDLDRALSKYGAVLNDLKEVHDDSCRNIYLIFNFTTLQRNEIEITTITRESTEAINKIDASHEYRMRELMDQVDTTERLLEGEEQSGLGVVISYLF
jgi:hypothetical protein